MFYSVVRKLYSKLDEEYYGDETVVRVCLTKRGAWRVADRYRQAKFGHWMDRRGLPHPDVVWTVRPFQPGDRENFNTYLTTASTAPDLRKPPDTPLPDWGTPDGLPKPPKRPASATQSNLFADGLWGPMSQQQWYSSRTPLALPEKIFPEDTAAGMKEREKKIRERAAIIRELQRKMNEEGP